MAILARSISNGALMLARRLGLSAPPYSRRNTVIIETLGRRSGKVRRTPVGCLDEEGKIIVVAEHGRSADYLRKALAREGRVRVSHRGRWRAARLRPLAGAPEPYLERMRAWKAAFVRRLGTDLRAVEITPE